MTRKKADDPAGLNLPFLFVALLFSLFPAATDTAFYRSRHRGFVTAVKACTLRTGNAVMCEELPEHGLDYNESHVCYFRKRKAYPPSILIAQRLSYIQMLWTTDAFHVVQLLGGVCSRYII